MPLQDDGGPIAPRMKLVLACGTLDSAQGSTFRPEGGLSLRDYFAAKAMQSYLLDKDRDSFTLDQWAAASYETADAMLKVRNSQ